MKKVTKILSIVLVIALVMTMSVVLFACGDESNNTPVETYSIQVIDLDDEVVFDGNYKPSEYKTVYDALKKFANVEASMKDDKVEDLWLQSINGTAKTPGYSLMYYVNDQLATGNIAQIEPKAGDKCVVKVECWDVEGCEYAVHGYDEVDQQINKVVYKYQKNILPALYENRTSYDDSNYWLDCMILAQEARGEVVNYSMTNVFVDSIANFGESISHEGKAYWALKTSGISMDDFKVKYQAYLDGLNDKSWLDLFRFAPALSLNMTSARYNELVNNSTFAEYTEQYDPDYNAWTNTFLLNFKPYDATILDVYYNKIDKFNVTSKASVLQMLVAANKAEEAKVVATKLMDAVNPETGYIHFDNNESVLSSANMSVNQIYTALSAYQTMRDTGKAYNVFK